MGYSSSFFTCFLLLAVVNGKPVVPALFIFGDSIGDNGNNNQLLTFVKANFPPYGRDFKNHTPTGRFCNGKLATDFIAEILGFTSYQPAYINLEDKGNNLLNGANFASAASAFYDVIPMLYNTIPLHRQLEYYKECQSKLVEIAGQSKASSIISSAIYMVIIGCSDFLNYYTNVLVHNGHTVDQFSDILLQSYSKYIQHLYALGARRIGVTNLAPTGCLPILITLFGSHSNGCVGRLNKDAIYYNKKLNYTSEKLQKLLPDLNLVVFDIYQPLYNLVTKPSENGFLEARRGCCGTGFIELSILCNEKSIGTCANASEYVFWDSVHLTEAANKLLADQMVAAGIFQLIS
ncbi:PREDICTED: GDSL esterase/lipase At5g22810-like [Lupinus angustifolius]|uniref:GDSL esterase/lipase At5g22810-like n=1 Tax=Lupinus angustifolius TaxID=3871 RepID=UPI00092FB5A7|nr:PREDICTED: GDSL esterase/lipase At5g22810-like [Lupinus angustifolius]